MEGKRTQEKLASLITGDCVVASGILSSQIFLRNKNSLAYETSSLFHKMNLNNKTLTSI